MECGHTKTETIDDGIRRCLQCKQEFCLHPKIDHDSTCMICGEYVTEVSMDKPWNDSNYSRTNQSVKNVNHYINYLDSLGYSSDIVENTMEKFTRVGCSSANEKNLLAACVWMAHIDIGLPRTMVEIAKKHKITKSGIKAGKALAFEYFQDYVTKYITVSDMIKKILTDFDKHFKVNNPEIYDTFKENYETYYKHMYNMAKFVEDNWERHTATKKSAPQNIASACVYLYLSKSPTLKTIVDTPTKKKEICKIMGPSSITIDKICKILLQHFINVV